MGGGGVVCPPHQFEEVNELVGVLAGRQVHKVTRDAVAEAGAGLDSHLAGGVAECQVILCGA